MRAEELRIGNFVWISDTITLQLYRQVEKVNIHHLMGLTGWKEPIVEIEPIPLTEEWLVKFGARKDEFEIDSYVLSSLTCDYRFFKSELMDGSFYWTCEKVLGDTYIEYVHQLQNLYFALVRQEL